MDIDAHVVTMLFVGGGAWLFCKKKWKVGMWRHRPLSVVLPTSGLHEVRGLR